MDERRINLEQHIVSPQLSDFPNREVQKSLHQCRSAGDVWVPDPVGHEDDRGTEEEYRDPHANEDPFGSSVIAKGVIDPSVHNAYIHFVCSAVALPPRHDPLMLRLAIAGSSKPCQSDGPSMFDKLKVAVDSAITPMVTTCPSR